MLFFVCLFFLKFAAEDEESILPSGGRGSGGKGSGFGPQEPINQTAIDEKKMEQSLSLTVLVLGVSIVTVLCVKKYCLSNR